MLSKEFDLSRKPAVFDGFGVTRQNQTTKEKVNTMNLCVLSGRLIRNATVRGSDPKTLSFTLETRYGANDGDKKDRASYAPCVLFNPNPETEALLTSNAEGLFIELEGRISGPNPIADGGRRFSTEVIVRNRSLIVSHEPALAS